MMAFNRRSILFVVVGLLLITSSVGAGWRELMPVNGGAVIRVAADAQGTLYAATNGGLLLSINGGESWQSAQGDLPTTDIDRVVPDPVEVGVVYAITDRGLFRTLDGGGVWTRLPLDLPAGIEITEMAIAPANTSALFVATWGAYVYRSLDRGVSWEQRAAGLSGGWGGPAFISAIAVDPYNPSRVYTSTWRGLLFRSDDAANTWYQISDGGTWANAQLVISRSHPNILYTTHDEYWFGRGTVLRSTDYGSTWTNVGRPADGIGVQGGQSDAGQLAVDPTNPDIVYVTTSRGIHKTVTGGGIWSWLLAPPVAQSYANSVVLLPSSPSTVLAGLNILGFYRSTDAGSTWEQLNDGIVSASITGLDVCRNAPSNIYLSVQASGPWRSTDGGETWGVMGAAQGLPSHSLGRVAVHPHDSESIILVSSDGTTTFLWRSQDGGVSFTQTATSYGPGSIAASPLAPERVFASVNDWQGGFLYSANGGTSWGISQWWYIYPQNYSFHPTLPNVVFSFGNQYTGHALGTKHVMWSSSGNGTGWTSTAFGQGQSGGLVALDQNDPSTLYASTSLGSEGTEGIFKFTVSYSGTSVSSVTRVPGTFNNGLTNRTVRDLVYDGSTATLFAATPSGVFQSRDQAATWEPLNLGLPYLSAGLMRVIPATPTSEAKLLVTTNGGLWEYSESTPVLPVPPTLTTSPAELLQKVEAGTVAITTVTGQSPLTTDSIELSLTTTLQQGMSFTSDAGNPAVGELVFTPGGNQRGETYRVGLQAQSTLDPTKLSTIDRYFAVIGNAATDAAALISTNTGGSLQTPDGAVTLTVPFGAIPPEDGVATVSMISLNQAQQASIYLQLPHGKKLGKPSSVYEIAINSLPHYTFLKPVAVTFTYEAGQDPATMVISVYDESIDAHVPVTEISCLAEYGLVPVTGSTATGGTVSVCTTTLSTWALSDLSTFVDVPDDDTPPSLELTLSPPPGPNGWNLEDVMVDATASDEPGGSGLSDITCVTTGAQAGTVSSPTALHVAITAEGSTELACVATDNAGNSSEPAVMTVYIDKAAPSLQVPGDITTDATSVAGAIVHYSVTATDTVDPAPLVSCTPVSGSTFPIGATEVSCLATDVAGNSATESFMVTIINRPPSVSAGGPYSVDEGGTVVLTASASDPENGPLVIDWDLDGDDIFEVTGASITMSAAGLDGPSTRSITARATDSEGATAVSPSLVTVVNLPPVAAPVEAPGEPIPIQELISVSAAFTDPGTPDTHTATWEWGDGSASAGSVTELNGEGIVTGTHAYEGAGLYTVSLTLGDDDGGIATSSSQLIIVVDPEAGFVTGGGWYHSPAGAYLPQPELNGKATFGLSSRYHRGASTPTGNTQLHLNVAGMKFQSSTYEWLVVTGARAQYRGTGTINGSGAYDFMLTAVDGQAEGGGDIDALRLKIWEHDGSALVYDSQPGVADEAPPATPVEGGSIVIHTP